MLLSFKSQYTVRVYTLPKQYERLEAREIELGLLRDMLGVRNDLHQEYRDFKRHVLQYAQKELAEKADICFEFTDIKQGAACRCGALPSVQQGIAVGASGTGRRGCR